MSDPEMSGEPFTVVIAPPVTRAAFSVKLQFRKVGEQKTFRTPAYSAVLPVNWQSWKVGLLMLLYAAPPLSVAVLRRRRRRS